MRAFKCHLFFSIFIVEYGDKDSGADELCETPRGAFPDSLLVYLAFILCSSMLHLTIKRIVKFHKTESRILILGGTFN